MNNSTEIEKVENKLTTKSLFGRDDVQQRFKEMLGNRATSFITSVLQIAASNDQLQKADPMSIYNAAAVAATLDLPLNANLGFAYIVAYNTKQSDGSYKVMAQFQMGYKGFKQLALRTGQFHTINATDVREGELKKYDRLTGNIEFEWIQNDEERLLKPIVGYVSFFQLANGYTQTYYMTIAQLNQHGKRYSKTYDYSGGRWKTDFDNMCLKTVVKLNLSKNAPLSVEMQKAVTTDQAVIKNEDATDLQYVDHEDITVDKEVERAVLMIIDCKTIDELTTLKPSLDFTNATILDTYTSKVDELAELQTSK